MFVVVRYLVHEAGVKVKLKELKSRQVKLLQYLVKTIHIDMNHICLIRLVVLKRPGFQSRKYGIPIKH